MPRLPDEIMADFHDGIKGTRDVDMVDLLWEIFADIQNSYRLAMVEAKINLYAMVAVEDVVVSYIVNNYGD